MIVHPASQADPPDFEQKVKLIFLVSHKEIDLKTQKKHQ